MRGAIWREMCIFGAYRILNDAQEPCAGLDTGAVTMYSIVVGPLRFDLAPDKSGGRGPEPAVLSSESPS